MPIFEYQCDDCSGRFEELVLSSQATSPSCPACSSDSVAKVYSTFAAKSSGPDPSAGGFCEPMASAGCGRCGDPAGSCSVN